MCAGTLKIKRARGTLIVSISALIIETKRDREREREGGREGGREGELKTLQLVSYSRGGREAASDRRAESLCSLSLALCQVYSIRLTLLE